MSCVPLPLWHASVSTADQVSLSMADLISGSGLVGREAGLILIVVAGD